MPIVYKDTYTVYYLDSNTQRDGLTATEAHTLAAQHVGNRSYSKPIPTDETYAYGPGDGTTSVIIRREWEFSDDAPQDHTKSPATQPYRTTPEAQRIARDLAAYQLPDGTRVMVDDTAAKGASIIDFTKADGSIVPAYRVRPDAELDMLPRCELCKTRHARQEEADACCVDEKARILGTRLGGIL